MHTFRLTSPHMHGAGVLQHDVNKHLLRWGVEHSPVKEDDEYGPYTRDLTHSVCFGLGISLNESGGAITPAVQQKIHSLSRLSASERKLLGSRKAYRHRLVYRLNGGGARKAVDFALAMASKHITEHPPGSNRGPYIDNWNRLVGSAPGPFAYWCGAFANACLMAAGFPPQHFLAYCPNTVAHAVSGQGGWRWVPLREGRPGDLALYREGAVAGHVEILIDPHPFTTVGGNTSADAASGSQSNGGGVFLRHRDPAALSFPVMGLARPPYN